MTRAEAFVVLNDILRDVLENESVTVDDRSDPRLLPGWDKLAEIDVLAAAEVRFGVLLRPAEAEPVTRMGALIDLILGKEPALVSEP